MPRQIGEVLEGKYELTARLGAGGMGEVYKAVHKILGSTRVIKVIHSDISGNTDAHERFMREARAATKVQSINVATLHDFSSLPDGSHYMVWEYIDGENVAQRLRTRGTLTPKQAIRIVVQALHGLEAIHRAGIIHRDISPENLMITSDDVVKIIDLGVAKVDDAADVSRTGTGIFVGKLRYASPEQLGFLPDGQKIDARTDLYSMGMVLYELLTGRPPYEAKSPHEYFILHAQDQHQRRTIELPRELPGGEALQAVLQKSLERDRNDRYASAAEFAAALEEVSRNLPAARDLPTMAIPRPDETPATITPPVPSRVDTLHRETVRTDAPAPPTVLTPVPQRRQPLPPVTPAVSPAGSRKQGVNPLVVILALLLVMGGLIAAVVLLWPSAPEPEVVTGTQPPPVVETTSQKPPQVAEASVNVIATDTAPPTATETQPPLVTTITTTTVAIDTAPPTPVRIIERPRREERDVRAAARRAKEEEEQPEAAPPTPPPAPAIATYVDGGDDEDANERLLSNLRDAVQGVNRVSIQGGAMQGELIAALKEAVPSLTVTDSADVVIRFDGTFERLARGRKRRAAQATITRRGRTIFRYELPEEVYRVGMSPAEAFANTLSNAFAE
jgi:serine/threonine-protein kinase